MDVSKIFSRSPDQGEQVPSTRKSPIVRQKSPQEIVREYLEASDSLEDPNENIVSEIETQIKAPKDILLGMTTAANPIRHPLSQKFHDLLKEVGELHDKKQMDYGTPEDPFANVRGSSEWGIASWLGAMIRANDKVVRIKQYAKTGSLENEGVRDSFLDLATYALIGLVLWEEQEANGD